MTTKIPLYHLRLSEIWNQYQRTGLVIENIPSGYAFVVEHFYAFLYQISDNANEHIVLSQIFHGLMRLGLSAVTAFHISRKFLPNKWSAVLLLFFLNPTFLSFSVLAKNDSFLLASITLGVFSCIYKAPSLFLMASLCSINVKITAVAPSYLLIASFSLLFLSKNRGEFWSFFKILTVGAFLMLAATSPFFINNYIVSGNPLFPSQQDFSVTLREFSAKRGVNEMQPFQAGLAELAQSIFNFFVRFPTILVALFLILSTRDVKQLKYDFGKAFLLLMSKVITGLLFYGFLFAPMVSPGLKIAIFGGLSYSLIFSVFMFFLGYAIQNSKNRLGLMLDACCWIISFGCCYQKIHEIKFYEKLQLRV